MTIKRFSASLLLLMLFTSAAYAKVTEQQALSDQRIAPYVEFTKQQGQKFLPGRYANVEEILSRAKPSEKITAATAMIVEIGQFNSENNAYPSNFDVWGEKLTPGYITLDTSGAVPIMKTYTADASGNYEVIAEDFAVVMADDNKRFAWLLASTETGEIRFFYPLNDFWFPEDWYEGSWLGSEGSQIEIDDGEVKSQGQTFGTYVISDNRIAVKTPDGQRDVICCIYNPYNETLVMTFTSGPNGMGENAGVFVKNDDDNDDNDKGPSTPVHMPKAPEPKKNNGPVFKAPSPKASTAPTIPTKPNTQTPPTGFPKFPGPAPEFSLEGVWQTYVNGQQLVMQFQGNNYYIWLNGQPAEMGTFQRNGDVLSGIISNTGQPFRNTIKFDSTGKSFTLTDTNNSSIIYQKVQ